MNQRNIPSSNCILQQRLSLSHLYVKFQNPIFQYSITFSPSETEYYISRVTTSQNSKHTIQESRISELNLHKYRAQFLDFTRYDKNLLLLTRQQMEVNNKQIQNMDKLTFNSEVGTKSALGPRSSPHQDDVHWDPCIHITAGGPRSPCMKNSITSTS